MFRMKNKFETMKSRIMGIKGRTIRPIHPSSRPQLIPGIACMYQLVDVQVVVVVYPLNVHVIAILKLA